MSGATDLAARIDALLPQTQCTRCGYSGCAPYAAAIAAGDADINQCPPGGQVTIEALSLVVGKPARPLNPLNGVESALRVAWIDETRCIGCVRCLPPCPVDAIVGAAKYLHSVVPELCTGCELCLAPCPVDCIEMRPAAAAAVNRPSDNRRRYAAHTMRLARRVQRRQRELDAKKASLTARDSLEPLGPQVPPSPADP